MFPYWILFSIFAGASVQSRTVAAPPRGTSVAMLLAGALIALMIGFRYEVGGDWEQYQNIYRMHKYWDLGQVLLMGDPGFGLFNWLGQAIGLDIWFVNLSCGVIFAWGLAQFCQHQPNPWLSILVAIPYLIIVVAMGYSRQAVAIGLIMAGLAHPGRVPRFFFLTLLAATFHSTAILMLPLVAFITTRNKVFAIGAVVMMAVLALYFLIAPSSDRLLVHYVQANKASEGAAIRVLMNVMPAVMFLLLRGRFTLDRRADRLWGLLSWGALLALAALLTTPSSTAIDRLALYLLPLQVFVLARLPEALSSSKNTKRQLLLAVIAYSAAVQFVWFNFGDHAEAWVPYKTFIG